MSSCKEWTLATTSAYKRQKVVSLPAQPSLFAQLFNLFGATTEQVSCFSFD